MKADKNSIEYKIGQKFGLALFVLILIGLVLWLILWGIGRLMPTPLTNTQIIEQTKQCTDAGMKPTQIMNGLTYDVTKIICTNKEDK